MACCNPWFKKYDYGYGYQGFYQIPCGYCLNCRKDKQQYYIDRAEYEYKKRLTASFVTFTYDDIYNIDLCAVRNPLGGFEYDVSKTGDKTPRFTLVYKHVTNFIDSIRHYIKEHTELHGVLCQPDFSYIYVGEYGDVWKRNHFHVLFFGLDFAFCKKLIFERWKYGYIDVLPLLDGGIRYVVKYMDKQVFGSQAVEAYDMKGLARPKIRMSVGFGKGLLLDNIKTIKEHDNCYPARHKTWRPISPYWKKLITGNVGDFGASKTLHSIIVRHSNIRHEMREYCLKDFSTKSIIKFKHDKALRRERELEIRIRMRGFPVEPFDEVRFNKFFSPSYRRAITEIPIDYQRLLADDYRDSLYDDEVPF